MIGNDIVDLKLAALESNWKRPRFLGKLFSIEEQKLIFSSEHQHQVVWLLWSMKEAAYKIDFQQHGKRLFNPSKLKCTFISRNKGWVDYNGIQYQTKSKLNDDFINTVAYSDTSEKVFSQQFKIENTSYQNQSRTAKEKLLESFSRLKNIPFNNLEIRTDCNNVPRLFQNGQQQSDSFSIAHHGHYTAFAISLRS